MRRRSLRCAPTGDIIEARARIQVRYRDYDFDVPPRGFPPPLAFLDAGNDGGAQARPDAWCAATWATRWPPCRS